MTAISPSDTNFASSAGFHFNSSGELLTAGAASAGSTQVAVSSVAGIVTMAGNSTVVQGTSPWLVSGNSTVVQGTSPWVVSGTVRANLSSTAAENPVVISGNSTVAPLAGSVWAIQGNSTVAPLAGSLWTIQGNSTVVISAGNSSVTITAGNSSVTISAFTPTKLNIGSTAADNAVVISGNSTVAPLAGSLWTTQGNSTVTILAGNSSVTITAGNSSVIITSAPAGWARAGFGSKSGQLSSAGDNTIISSVAGKTIFVYGWTLTPLSTGANLIRWMDGSTTEVWRCRVLGGSTAGMNYITSELAVSPPSYLFKTAAASFLGMNATSSGVNYGIAYWQE